jgi:hypothetical protein
MLTVIGVDPGARETGLVLGQWAAGRLTLTDHRVVRRVDARPVLDVPTAYLAELVAKLRSWTTGGPGLVAIEGVTVPHPHGRRGLISPAAPMATAVVFGAVLGQAWPWPVTVIAPAQHGKLPAGCYPPGIRGRPGGKGADRLRHCRSAWDVARAAAAQTRVTAAPGRG